MIVGFLSEDLPLVVRLNLIFPQMILWEGLSVPSFYLCPWLRGICPKGIVGRQSERHEAKRRHVFTAIVGIPVCHLRLMTAESDVEKPFLVVVVTLVAHAVHNLCQGSTHLSVAEFFRHLLVPRQ